jgi:hypothetical protein
MAPIHNIISKQRFVMCLYDKDLSRTEVLLESKKIFYKYYHPKDILLSFKFNIKETKT